MEKLTGRISSNLIELYHGNDLKDISIFDIDKTNQNGNNLESVGLYLTENKIISESYGKFIHKFIIDDSVVYDMTSKQSLNSLFELFNSNLKNEFKIDLFQLVDIQDIIDRLIEGELAISNIAREIELIIDSDYESYELIQKYYNDELDENLIYQNIKNTLKNIFDNYVIKYNEISFEEPLYIVKTQKMIDNVIKYNYINN